MTPAVVWIGIVALLALVALAVGRLRRLGGRPAPPPLPAPSPPSEVSPPPSVPPAAPPPVPAAAPRTIAGALSSTREGFVGRLRQLVRGRAIDVGLLDEMEEVLFGADLGVRATTALLETLRERVGRREASDPAALQRILREEIRRMLGDPPPPPLWADAAVAAAGRPYVVMAVGVNGVGKTTTIGKLAKRVSDSGRKVLLGAGDTFRAAAAEQLQIWAERAGADVVANKEGTDPSAVAFDAAKAAVARGADVMILDTAGRLHSKQNLMEELKKVRRVVGREIPGSPHETLLVVDATTGQNALAQAREFHAAVGVTGVALTKLDGSAKGGIVIAIRDELQLPIRYVGIGEAVEDLKPFDPDEFVDALFSV